MKAFSFKGIWILLKDSIKGFSRDKLPKLGGSLAYFTIFSIGPMMLVVIFFVSLILGREAVQGSLQGHLQQVVGEDVARQLQQIVRNAATNKQGLITGIIGIIGLLLGATSVFGEIQDSINGIWKIQFKPRQGWRLLLRSRIIAFLIIVFMGLLLFVSVVASGFIEGLGNNLGRLMPGVTVAILYIISQFLSLLTSTLLFGVVFKILPAAIIKWRDVWPGAVMTALLFMIGRFAISIYIGRSDLGSTYGVAGSLVVLMVWIYYSSLILYFGAEFTRAYSKRFGSGIRPNAIAISTE